MYRRSDACRQSHEMVSEDARVEKEVVNKRARGILTAFPVENGTEISTIESFPVVKGR